MTTSDVPITSSSCASPAQAKARVLEYKLKALTKTRLKPVKTKLFVEFNNFETDIQFNF